MSDKVRKRTPGCTRVSSKNQVTIPIAALRAAHIDPGDVVEVTVEGDGTIRLSRAIDPWHELFGSAPGLSAATNLEALRDEWDR